MLLKIKTVFLLPYPQSTVVDIKGEKQSHIRPRTNKVRQGKTLLTLNSTDSVPEELWTEVHDIVQEAGIKTIPKEKKCKKAKWLAEEALQITEKKEVKGKGKRENYT